ncbi:MAG TPA: AIR synthase-related protein [Nitrososphaerales archaeon]|nr:AIR synthase-related protein [Nitrososphaerales archaeon]
MKADWGKLDAGTMERIVYGHLGAKSHQVLVGPKRGSDNAIVSIGGRRVLIVTTDPVSVIPALGAKESAWLSVHLIASDYATSGRLPQFATFDFNFPPEMTRSDTESYLKEIGSACRRLGISIVAGHTGSYPGAGYTVVGGGVMFGFAKEGEYVDPSMANVGDAVLMTKGAAIEAAASLSNSFPMHTERLVGRSLAAKAMALTRSCSVVKDAVTAATLGLGEGGVTSMHDATEGGVLGGLGEMAAASGKAFVVKSEKILQLREAAAVCSAFGLDPLTALSEGTLLITCASERAGELLRKLEDEKVGASLIGTVSRGRGLWVSEKGRSPRKVRPSPDKYWVAYARAINKGLR